MPDVQKISGKKAGPQFFTAEAQMVLTNSWFFPTPAVKVTTCRAVHIKCGTIKGNRCHTMALVNFDFILYAHSYATF